MKSWALWVSFISVLLLQSFITTLPLIIVWLVIFYVFFQDSRAFFLAFLSGVILDSSSVQTIGLSSLYLVGFVFLLSLYEKKFEIQTLPFVALSSFLGAVGYLWITDGSYMVWPGIVSAICTAILFYIFPVKHKEVTF
jgi:cell shape-determining protein MreD